MDMTETLQQALSQITDPDLLRTFGELNAIHNIEYSNNTVKIYLLLPQPIHYVAEAIDIACKKVVASVLPEAKTEIFIAGQETPAGARAVLPKVKNLIAVSSGKGGVGKSTVTANLAVTLARTGAKVGLIDGDIHGPSMPTMFGLEGEQLHAEKMPDGKIVGYPFEKYGVQLASMGFVLQQDQAAILRGPMQAGYFSTLFEQIYWDELDFLLFDMPPGTGDIQLTLTQKIPLTGAVVVTTPQHVALADVRRGISMFRKVNVNVLGIIENMSCYVLPDGSKDYIFGQDGGKKMAAEYNAPFLGEVPINTAIRSAGDAGAPVVLSDEQQAELFENIARNLVAEVRRSSVASATPLVQISL